MATVKNVVLVHGGFVDGAGWAGVYRILRKSGYQVSVVQNPTTSLQDDVGATQRVLGMQDGPAILVGHSYGGAVITEAGRHPRVAALVYITAFAPDAGESVATLIKDPPPGAPVPPILPPQDGFLLLDKSKFHTSFAADVDAETATFMADSQVPWGLGALSGAVSGLEEQAELVPGRDRGSDDSRGRTAGNGQAGGRHDRGNERQPRHLRLAAWTRGGADRAGGQGRGLIER